MRCKSIVVWTVFLLLATLSGGCSRADKQAAAEPKDAPEKSAAESKTPPKIDEPEVIELDTNGVPDEEKRALKKLAIYGAKSRLDEQSHVVRVVLEGKQVTNKALDEVVKLPELRSLSLGNSSVTDAGLLKLRELTMLDSLGITNTPVTDAGLKHLEGMPSLRYIWVCENDKLTPQGIASLRDALNGVNVYIMNQKK